MGRGGNYHFPPPEHQSALEEYRQPTDEVASRLILSSDSGGLILPRPGASEIEIPCSSPPQPRCDPSQLIQDHVVLYHDRSGINPNIRKMGIVISNSDTKVSLAQMSYRTGAYINKKVRHENMAYCQYLGHYRNLVSEGIIDSNAGAAAALLRGSGGTEELRKMSTALERQREENPLVASQSASSTEGVQGYQLDQLRAQCRAKGLPSSGTVSELIDRLYSTPTVPPSGQVHRVHLDAQGKIIKEHKEELINMLIDNMQPSQRTSLLKRAVSEGKDIPYMHSAVRKRVPLAPPHSDDESEISYHFPSRYRTSGSQSTELSNAFSQFKAPRDQLALENRTARQRSASETPSREYLKNASKASGSSVKGAIGIPSSRDGCILDADADTQHAILESLKEKYAIRPPTEWVHDERVRTTYVKLMGAVANIDRFAGDHGHILAKFEQIKNPKITDKELMSLVDFCCAECTDDMRKLGDHPDADAIGEKWNQQITIVQLALGTLTHDGVYVRAEFEKRDNDRNRAWKIPPAQPGVPMYVRPPLSTLTEGGGSSQFSNFGMSLQSGSGSTSSYPTPGSARPALAKEAVGNPPLPSRREESIRASNDSNSQAIQLRRDYINRPCAFFRSPQKIQGAVLFELVMFKICCFGWQYTCDFTTMFGEFSTKLASKAIIRLILDRGQFLDSSCSQMFTKVRDIWQQGAQIRLLDPKGGQYTHMHAKTLIFDYHTVLSGSANFTHNGLERNTEHLFRFTDPQTVEEVLQGFEEDWDIAIPVSAKDMGEAEENHANRKRASSAQPSRGRGAHS